MPLSSTLTYDQAVWHRPGIDELGGGAQKNVVQPRDPRSVPHVDVFNQLSRQLVAVGKLVPSARLQVEFIAGVPTITQLSGLATQLQATDFAVFHNGPGDTSITLSGLGGETLLPHELTIVEDVDVDRSCIAPIPGGWRVKTKLGATGVDAAFVFALHAAVAHPPQGYLLNNAGSFLVNALGAQLVSFGCVITSPAFGGAVAQGSVVSITGTISRPGAVVVKLGNTTVGAGVVSGLNWSLSWTPQLGDVGAQTLTAVATDTETGVVGSAQGVPITVTSGAQQSILLTGIPALEAFGTPSLSTSPAFPGTVTSSDIVAWMNGDVQPFQDLAGTTPANPGDPVGCFTEASPLSGQWKAPTLGQRLHCDGYGVRSDYFGAVNPGQTLVRGACSIPQDNSTLVVSFTPRDGVAGPQDGLCLASPFTWGAFYAPFAAGSVCAYYNGGTQWVPSAFVPVRAARVTAVIRWTSTGLKAWVMVNGVLTTATLVTAVSAGSGPTGASGIKLAYGAGGTVGLYASISQCLIMNRSCTDAEGAALAAWADAKLQPPCYPINQPLIGCVGDSIERAATGVAANQGHCWIALGNLRATYPGLEQCNVAVSGSGIATTPAVTYAALTPLYSASRAKNIIHIAIGTNDIATGSTAAAVIAGLQSAAGTLKAQGWLVAMATILPRSDPMSVSTATFNSLRAVVNAWITGSAVSTGYADVINDAAGVSGMGADGDSDNTTNYFFSVTGGVHPTAVGMALLVPARQAALAALLA